MLDLSDIHTNALGSFFFFLSNFKPCVKNLAVVRDHLFSLFISECQWLKATFQLCL